MKHEKWFMINSRVLYVLAKYLKQDPMPNGGRFLTYWSKTCYDINP